MGFLEIMRARRLSESRRERKGEARKRRDILQVQSSNEALINLQEWEGPACKSAAGFCMRSRVLNALVDVEFGSDTADAVSIGGVVYRETEIKDLLSRNLDAEKLRTVHEIKRVFEGTVCEGF